VRSPNKRKKKLNESESMLQRIETMKESTRRLLKLCEKKRNKRERGAIALHPRLISCVDREIKQKNEGQYVFRWDEERSPGNIILEVELSRHLDSSLIDVDVHPTYVSVIVKSKVGGARHKF
jgi:protein TilB